MWNRLFNTRFPWIINKKSQHPMRSKIESRSNKPSEIKTVTWSNKPRLQAVAWIEPRRRTQTTIRIEMRWWCVCWVWFSRFWLACLLGLVLQLPIDAFVGFGLAGEDLWRIWRWDLEGCYTDLWEIEGESKRAHAWGAKVVLEICCFSFE